MDDAGSHPGLSRRSPRFSAPRWGSRNSRASSASMRIFARSSAVQAAYGFSVPAGTYMRSGLVAGIGVGRHGVEGRTDLIGRFSLDPLQAESLGAVRGRRRVGALPVGARRRLSSLPARVSRGRGAVTVGREVGLGACARGGARRRRASRRDSAQRRQCRTRR